MMRIDKEVDISGGRSASSTLIIVLGFLFAGFFIGQLVGALSAMVVAVLNGLELGDMMADPNAIYDYMSLTQVLFTQTLYTLVFTIITPWFYLKVLAGKTIHHLSPGAPISSRMVLMAFLATAGFIFVNAYFVEWNQGVQLPEFMSGFENWARELEDQLAEATKRFTTFNNFGEFLVGFVVIAIIPGIGEELLFRGVLQNSLHRLTKNKHIAIWVAAFLFSAIHIQFYGLVPRMMLGAVFGYLYVWSGNLWYPMIAHATNNGLAVIIAYASQSSESEFDIDEVESVPLVLKIIGAIVFLVMIYGFKKESNKQNSLL